MCGKKIYKKKNKREKKCLFHAFPSRCSNLNSNSNTVITPVNLFRAIKRIVLYQYRVMTVFEFEFFCFDDQPIFDIVDDDDDDERIFSNPFRIWTKKKEISAQT